MKTKIICLFIFISYKISFAGGSVIGNGAGLVENNFQFAYSNLENYITSCLINKKCEMSESENLLLSQIIKVIQKNRSNENRLIFISEKNNPGFFDTGINEKHRVAKTELHPDSPIYINSDFLYNYLGQAQIDLSTAFSILVHEIGHQTGEKSHTKLDIIGSKLKKLINQKISIQKIQIAQNQNLTISVLNQSYPAQLSQLLIDWDQVGSYDLTPELMKSISCSDQSTSLLGFEIYNGHFININLQNRFNQIVEYGIWVNLFCYSEETRLNTIEKKQIEFKINQDLKILDIKS